MTDHQPAGNSKCPPIAVSDNTSSFPLLSSVLSLADTILVDTAEAEAGVAEAEELAGQEHQQVLVVLHGNRLLGL